MLARIRRERTDLLAAQAAATALADASEGAAADAGAAGAESHDLALSLRLVRALLTTNEEIWQRCRERMCTGATGTARAVDVDGRQFFTRLIYRFVDARPVPYICQEAAPGKQATTKIMTRFYVSASYEKLTIRGIPTMVPEELASIVAVPMKDGFPDYPTYFETALMLHDDALPHFLNRFRLHLETVQVGLGKIEAWLEDAKDARAYLERTFPGSNLPDPVKRGCVGCNRMHGSNEVCLNCGNVYSRHGYGGYTELFVSEKRPGEISRHVCPVRLGSACSATYQKKMPEELETSFFDTGEHSETFDSCTKSGRSKLEKFLAFLEE